MTKATYTLWGDHMRDYMDRRVIPPKRVGLPHLRGVPHLHVNRPYFDVDNRERARERDKKGDQFCGNKNTKIL